MNSLLNMLSLDNNNTATGGVKAYGEIVKNYIKNNINCDKPLFLSLKITSLCNCKCLYCIADTKTYKDNELDKSKPILINRLLELRKSKKPVVFALCGGEPLLFPKRCIEYFKVFYNDDDIIFSVASNLSFEFTEEHEILFKLLESRPLSFIQTSIDSLSDDTHNKLRKGSNLELTLKNIKYLKLKNIKIKVNLTISEYNYKDVFEVIDWIYNNDIESLHINHVLPYGRASNIVNEYALIKIIKTLLKVSQYDNFLKIREHTITWPSEIFALSLIGSKIKDIQNLYITIKKEEIYPSSNFVFTISHDSELCNFGWRSTNLVDLNKKSILQRFNSLKKIYDINKTQYCSQCKLRGYCDIDSFYSRKCLLLDLKDKIEVILNQKLDLSKEEKARLDLLSYLNKRIDSVLEVIISYTKKCNGDCIFCQVSGSNNKDEDNYFTSEDLLKSLSGNNYIVEFTGGEPLIRQRELGKLIPKLKSAGHIVGILTNLVLIDDEFINILKESFSYNDYLQVSVYCNNPTLHHEITGRDDWEELNNKIAKVVSAGIPLRANITLTYESMDYLKETIEYYKSLGISQISINGLLKKGRATEMVNEFYLFKYINCIYEYVMSGDMSNISLSVPIEVIKTLSNIKSILNIEYENIDLNVKSRNNKIKIDNNGNIIAYLTQENIDNIKMKKIKDIKLKDIERNLSKSECANCSEFNRCNGYIEYINMINPQNKDYSYCDLL